MRILSLPRFRRWRPLAIAMMAASFPLGVAGDVLSQEPAPAASKQEGGSIVRPGDRIVLLGGGWVERMHNHPWLEMMIGLQVPGVTFRNMGWSGDTVHGDARAVFGSRPDGYARLLRDLEYAAPKLALVCYGENEAFGGESERSACVAGYAKLIEDLRKRDCRVVLVIPRRRENAGSQYPDPTAYNEQLAKLAAEIRNLGREKDCPVLDLEKFEPNERFTRDGVAWNDAGYRKAAAELVRQLGLNGAAIDRLSEKQPEALEELRAAVKKKNEWFFHRYRPQNETYLFLFRKHEQGNNAVEVEQMETFVRQGEEKIAEWLKQHALQPAQ